MNSDQIEAARALIDFARTYAHDAYGDESDEQMDAKGHIEYTLEAAKILETYLD